MAHLWPADHRVAYCRCPTPIGPKICTNGQAESSNQPVIFNTKYRIGPGGIANAATICNIGAPFHIWESGPVRMDTPTDIVIPMYCESGPLLIACKIHKARSQDSRFPQHW